MVESAQVGLIAFGPNSTTIVAEPASGPSMRERRIVVSLSVAGPASPRCHLSANRCRSALDAAPGAHCALPEGINTRMGHIQHDTNSDRKGRVGDGSANTLKLRENYLA
jgi:hypothetical protein